MPPGEDRALSLKDAIAVLGGGEVKRKRVAIPGSDVENFPGLRPRSEQEIDRLLRPPPPPLPPWLEPLAELVAEKLKPVVRAEARSAVRAEARRQAREPTM